VKIGAIVQARMGSTRLPGKVLFEAQGKTLLEHLMERIGYCKTLDFTVVATSTNPRDDVIVALCCNHGFPVFRGSEMDVLDRYHEAARHFRFDVVVRISSDCPLVDPALTDEIISVFMNHRDEYDLVTNRHPLTFPDGLDVDVMSFSALEHVWRNATEAHQREHTIPYFWESGMRVFNFEHPDNLFVKHRWTLDYWEDYQLIKAIFEGLYRPGHPFGMKDILNYLKTHPHLFDINAAYLPTSVK